MRAEARVETARLRFAAAARLHEQAARLLPAEDREGRAADWESAGLRWTDQGRDFGDNPALLNAIAAFQAALEEQTREHAPLDWARTQLNLANAFYFLGEREAGTGRLEAAVVAYRLALQETTRERMPRDWAATQTNLGVALAALGERESGTDRLQESAAAYRLALQERTRERMPLDWASTQVNLASVLVMLGEREVGDGSSGGGGGGLPAGASGDAARADAVRLGARAGRPRHGVHAAGRARQRERRISRRRWRTIGWRSRR